MSKYTLESFRDPCGHVAVTEEAVFRFITEVGSADFAAVEKTSLFASLIKKGRLWPYEDVAIESEVGRHGFRVSRTLLHPRLPFVSYPYEWPFSALKSAALFHLDVQIEALDSGVVLKDATPMNVQFVGGSPVFIDHLSFQPYVDGAYWVGHSQFHNQFYGPLLLEHATGVPCSTFYRSNPEGLSATDVNRLLPLKSLLRPYVVAHICLPAWFAKRATSSRRPTQRPLPMSVYRSLLTSARAAISRLNSGVRSSTWGDYATNNSYSGEDEEQKQRFVAGAVAAERPMQVLDIGCNTGVYALSALKAGASFVVGIDSDPLAVDKAFRHAQEHRLSFIPLVVDFVAPTPALGWQNRERMSLLDRLNADFILGLAVIHHLVFGRNVPLRDAVAAVVALAPAGVIEFIPSSDPMVRKIAAGREALFPEYTEESFRQSLLKHAVIRDEMRVTAHGRILVRYRRVA